MVWKNTLEVPNSRKLHCKIIYLTHPGQTTREGYPILWVHSSAKAINDNHQRQKRVNDCYESLKKRAGKLNHYHLKTAQEIEAAILKALTGNSDYFDYQIIEETQIVKKQNLCYKPGKNTKYEEKTKTTYRLEYQLNQKTLNQASLLDA